jgi:acetyltransferase
MEIPEMTKPNVLLRAQRNLDVTQWGSAAFSPRRIALVGASAEAGKVGRLLFDNLLEYGGGEVIPIHPSAFEVLGRQAYASVSSVPDHIDLAVVVTPANTILQIVEDCARAKVSTVIVLSGGFAETGSAGALLEAELSKVARLNNIRLIGPNCFGLIDTPSGLNASMAMGIPATGGVSLFTQSGSYGMAAFSRSREGAIGFNKVLSAGNKADINEVDAVYYFGQDPHTRVIALVLESLSDGPGLVSALRAVTPCKPVVILKTGRSLAGQRAASSHTAALAQDFKVTRSILRQAGAILVDDGLTLFDVAAALDRQPPLRGRRIAIISNSGGTGVELADLCEAVGLEVPMLSPELRETIASHLPAHGSAANPIDVTTAWQHFPMMYAMSLRALLASDEVDAVVPVLLQRSALDVGVVDAVIAQSQAAIATGSGKPVHVCWVPPIEGEPMRQKLLDAGIPCHDWAARTARVLSHCQAVVPDVPPEVGASLPSPDQVLRDGWLEPEQLFPLLASWGLPIMPWQLVANEDAAAQAALEIGFPVVLKAVRPGLIHKTDAGAVRLALDSVEEVRDAFAQFVRALGPGSALLQRQAERGVELMVGAIRDPTFGPVMVCGLGGIWTEALGDVSIRLAPISPNEAQRSLNELRGKGLLDGLRGAEPVDRQGLSELMSRVSICMARAPWCVELDLNPVISNRNGFVIVDARMRIERSEL